MPSFVIKLGLVGQKHHLELGQNTHLVTQHLNRGMQSQIELEASCPVSTYTAARGSNYNYNLLPKTSITDKGIRM